MFIPYARRLGRWSPRPLTAGLIARSWWLLLVVGGSLAVIRLLLPPLAAATIYDLLSLATALAIVAGIVIHRPEHRLPWLLLALAQLLYLGGDVLWDVWLYGLGEAPFPSVADLSYLSAYPAIVVALLLMIRARSPGSDRKGLIEALIVTSGVAVASWTFLIDPYLQDTSLGVLDVATSVAYPLADLLLVAVIVRLMVSSGARTVSYWFLSASLLLALAADTLFAVQALQSSYVENSPLDLLFLASYLSFGAAALHPSMHDVATPAPRDVDRLSWRRFALMMAAALAGPSIIAVEWLNGLTLNVPVLVGGCIVGSALVVIRLTGAVHTLAGMLAERDDLQIRLSHLAFHDDLTGLANRALFLDRVAHALSRRQLRSAKLAVLLVDLDDFKTVNDSVGHDAGDELLIAVGERIRLALRGHDTVARLGGDEFSILVDDLDDDDEAIVAGERLLAQFAVPFEIRGREFFVTPSIGVALAPDTDTSAEAILRDADIAMYRAKARGKGQLAVFEPEMRLAMHDRLALQADLRGAVERDEFRLLYQPVVEIGTRRLVGAEALLRWQHPTRGLLTPADFLLVAEETGLIVQIGRWVLASATAEASRWLELAPNFASITVNLSARELLDPGLPALVASALTASGLPAERLVLEITEGILVEQGGTLDALAHLRALGVRLAMDDFGTGFSSLGNLRRLPIHIVKIDQSFVLALDGRTRNEAVVEAILRLCEALGYQPIAEGVETEAQAASLLAMGCNLGQGYLFAKPLEASKIVEHLVALNIGPLQQAHPTLRPELAS